MGGNKSTGILFNKKKVNIWKRIHEVTANMEGWKLRMTPLNKMSYLIVIGWFWWNSKIHELKSSPLTWNVQELWRQSLPRSIRNPMMWTFSSWRKVSEVLAPESLNLRMLCLLFTLSLDQIKYVIINLCNTKYWRKNVSEFDLA